MEQRSDVNLQDLKGVISDGEGNVLGHAMGNGILASVPGMWLKLRQRKHTQTGFREG